MPGFRWTKGLTFGLGGAAVAGALLLGVDWSMRDAGTPVALPHASTSLAPAAQVSAPLNARAARAYGRLPLAFQPNLGEADSRFAFLARGGGSTIALNSHEAALALRSHAKGAALVRMQLVGARGQAQLRPSERLPGTVNEFLGNDRSRWRAGVPTFARLTARGVYPGIDLSYYGRQGRLEYDFVLSPGADASVLALRFQGTSGLRIDRGGNLLLSLPGGELRQGRPDAYQVVGGRRLPVSGVFVLRPQGLVGFRVGRYDPALPLVIDPTVDYSTYLGGTDDEIGNSIAIDSSGNAYVAGYTGSTNIFSPAPVLAYAGGNDAFVAKLDSTGTSLLYSTYLGGTGDETAFGIAVSGTSAYVTGSTNSTDFPTLNALQAANAGGSDDAFVTKLTSAGALSYSTYLGGSTLDEGLGIAVDSSGNAYVAGDTDSTNFPTAPGLPLQASNAGGTDAFVTKLTSTGGGPTYSTYLGGGVDDSGHGIAVDSSGNAYVTGATNSTDFPTTAGVFQLAKAGAANINDVFVTELDTAGTAKVYSTYLGGTNDDNADAIAVDSSGNAYVTGQTFSTDFPLQAAIQGTIGSAPDAFVTKLNSTGTAPLTYSTYLGGTGDDRGLGIAVDSAGAAFVTGFTYSTDFPTQLPFQVSHASDGGKEDAFVTKLNVAGSAKLYSSYLGGTGTANQGEAGNDGGHGIAVNTSGSDAYVTGYTNSVDFPTAGTPYQSTHQGFLDAFVTKITTASTAVVVRSFAAARTGRTVVLRWRTGSEATLLGFNVYRQVGVTRVRLNRSLILAGSVAGRSYAFRDRLPGRVRGARYWLEEVRLTGARVWHGPVRPSS